MSYFTEAELFCRCGRPSCDALTRVSPDLFTQLNSLRDRIGSPLRVTSALRCRAYNATVGGVGDSPHLRGEAVDIACEESMMRWTLLAANCQKDPLFTRVGIGRTFIHFDIASSQPRVIWLYKEF